METLATWGSSSVCVSNVSYQSHIVFCTLCESCHSRCDASMTPEAACIMIILCALATVIYINFFFSFQVVGDRDDPSCCKQVWYCLAIQLNPCLISCWFLCPGLGWFSFSFTQVMACQYHLMMLLVDLYHVAFKVKLEHMGKNWNRRIYCAKVSCQSCVVLCDTVNHTVCYTRGQY